MITEGVKGNTVAVLPLPLLRCWREGLPRPRAPHPLNKGLWFQEFLFSLLLFPPKEKEEPTEALIVMIHIQ